MTHLSMLVRIGLIDGWGSGEIGFQPIGQPCWTVCARALNPSIVEDYFQKLGETISKHRIDPDCLWSMDETSIAFGHVCKTRVIGHAGNHVQLSQRDGNRETATLMPSYLCCWCMHATLCHLQRPKAQLNLVNTREQPTCMPVCPNLMHEYY